jgi:hypothetical protein
LNERTDLPALAAEVVEECKLIHPSKVQHVLKPTAATPAAMHSLVLHGESAATADPAATAVDDVNAFFWQSPSSKWM